jgi:hypothetical protein
LNPGLVLPPPLPLQQQFLLHPG